MRGQRRAATTRGNRAWASRPWRATGLAVAAILALAAPARAATQQTALSPVADAYVDSDQARANFGTATTLQVAEGGNRQTKRRAFLRFQLANQGGSITSARLVLRATTSSSNAVEAHAVSNTTWSETGINWSNAPAIANRPLGLSPSAFAAGDYVSIPVTAAVTANGTYSFAIVGTSVANVSFASREALYAPQLIVTSTDTTAPAVSVMSPAAGSVSPTGAVSFSGAAGTAAGDRNAVTVNVYQGSSVTGTPLEQLNAAASGGRWSTTASPSLGDGTYTVQARQSDLAGNVGTSAAVTFRVKSTAPAVTLTSPQGGGFVATSTPTFSGAAGTAPGDSAIVNVKVYAGSSAAGSPVQSFSANAAGGSWSTQAPQPLADGAYTAQATQGDDAGHTGTSSAATFRVKATAPAVTLTSPNDGAAVSSPTPTFSGAAGTAPGDSATVNVKVYAGSSATGSLVQSFSANAAGGSWSTQAPQPLADGTYTVQAQQPDEAGNTGTSAAVTFRVDTSAPGVTLTSPADGASVATATPSFSGDAGTAPGDGSTVTIDVYSGSSASGMPVESVSGSAGGGSWSASASPALANGIYTARATQSDSAGNTGRSQAVTFTVAVVASVTISQPGGADQLATPTPTISGSAGNGSGDGAPVRVDVYSGTSASGEPADTVSAARSGASWSVTTHPLANGTYTVQASQASSGTTATSVPVTFSVQAPFRAQVQADGPDGYWRLGEASGTTAVDAAGGNDDAFYEGGYTLGQPGGVPGDPDTSVVLDGSSGQVRTASTPSLGAGSGLTVEALVYPATLAPSTQAVARKDGQYLVRITSSGQVIFRLWQGGAAKELTSGAGIVAANRWNDIATTYDGSTMRIYVNGRERANKSLGGAADTVNGRLYMGSSNGYDFLSGRLDEVAVYSKALSAARLAAQAGAIGDNSPPAVTLATPAAGSSMDAAPNFGGIAGTSDGDAGSVQVNVYAGGSTAGSPVQRLTAQRDGSGVYSVVASALPSGTYTAQVIQSDTAGNTGRSSPATFSVNASLDPSLLLAGDIAGCDTSGDEATAAILDRLPGIVDPVGDLVYEMGTADEFANCYDPSWGVQKARTKPTVGGHEYNTPNAAPYFAYWGDLAGDPAKGYYSFDLGTWHVINLNAECEQVGGCWYGDPEEQWLRDDLAAHPAQCTIATLYEPRFSSGSVHGSNSYYQPFWRDLYDAGVELVIDGDDHEYERFAPQTPDGTADDARGITEIVAGTGGRSHYNFGTIQPNSVVRNNDTFGILQVSLHPGSYDFRFVPEAGKTFTDAGAGACH